MEIKKQYCLKNSGENMTKSNVINKMLFMCVNFYLCLKP